MAQVADGGSDAGQRERRLTVARVRTLGDDATVTFHETARIYRMPGNNPGFADGVRLLRSAASARTPVRVRFFQPNGDLIESVSVDE